MNRLGLTLLLALFACSTPNSAAPSASPGASSAVASPSASAVAPASQKKLDGKVVAIAADGTALVQRGTHVDVVSADRSSVKQAALGDPAARPGVRYAVADKGRYAARIDDGAVVELWDVAAGREVARIDTGEQSWGPPAFLSDDLMATHHRNWVTLWELPSGARHCTFKDRAIRLARESFAVSEGVAAMRGSSNSPGVSNTLILEYSTRDCSLRERHLVNGDEPARLRGSGTARFILSDWRLRMRSEARNLEAPLPGVSPAAVFAASDNTAVVWAGFDSKKANEHVVGLWRPEASRMVELGRVSSESYVAQVRIAGGSAFALMGDGEVVVFPLPAAGAGKDAGQVTVGADQLAREEAIIQLGLNDVPAALRALGRIASPDAKAATRFFAAYVQSLQTNERGDAFLKRMKTEKVAYAGEASTLAVAADLTRAQVIGPAFDVFILWLEGARPGSLPETGATVGLELEQRLGEADATEPRAALLKRLRTVYPQNAKVAEALKDLDE